MTLTLIDRQEEGQGYCACAAQGKPLVTTAESNPNDSAYFVLTPSSNLVGSTQRTTRFVQLIRQTAPFHGSVACA